MTHATIAAEEATRRVSQQTRRYDGVVCFALGDCGTTTAGILICSLRAAFASASQCYTSMPWAYVPSRERSVFITRIRRKLRSLMRPSRWDERFSVLSPDPFRRTHARGAG